LAASRIVISGNRKLRRQKRSKIEVVVPEEEEDITVFIPSDSNAKNKRSAPNGSG